MKHCTRDKTTQAFGDDDEMEYNKHFPASPTTLRQRNTKEIPRKGNILVVKGISERHLPIYPTSNSRVVEIEAADVLTPSLEKYHL